MRCILAVVACLLSLGLSVGCDSRPNEGVKPVQEKKYGGQHLDKAKEAKKVMEARPKTVDDDLKKDLERK